MSPNDRAEPPGLAWWRVPEDELGVALPDRVVVACSHQFAIIVGEITAYTRGFQVTAAVRVSRHLSEKDREWFVPEATCSGLQSDTRTEAKAGMSARPSVASDAPTSGWMRRRFRSSQPAST